MQEDGILVRLTPFSGELLLLAVAVLLAIGFLGLLVLDLAKRRRRKRRHQAGAKGLRAQLGEAFSRMRAFQGELKKAVHRRARRHGEHRGRRRSTQR